MRLKKFALDKIPENTLLLKSLKQIDGYPVFSDISIRYERFSEKKSYM